jgi:pimeloyl-ACP methyl ester carboxylesterase
MTLASRCALAGLVVLAGCSYRHTVHPLSHPEPIRREVDVAGVRVSYEYLGDSATSGPVVILLHGFGASLESWSDVAPLLASTYPVLRLDLKGFGLSTRPRDGKYSARDQADVVVGVIRQLGIRRPVIVGHSFGGAVAFATYLELRDGGDSRTAALVLIDAGVYRQPLPFFIVALRSTFTRFLMYTFTSADWRANVVLKRAYFEDSVATAERIRSYSKYFDLPGAHYAFERSAEQIVPPDAAALEQRLTTITVPTLAIWGADDEIIPVSFAYRLRTDVPGVTVKILDQTGHAPQEERPTETAQAILQFLATIPR